MFSLLVLILYFFKDIPLCITFCIFPALVFCNIDVTLSCSCWDHLEQLVIVLEEGKCFCVIHLFLSYFPLEMPNYILYLSWNRACLVFVDHFRIVYSCLVYSCIMNINALQEFFCAFFFYTCITITSSTLPLLNFNAMICIHFYPSINYN